MRALRIALWFLIVTLSVSVAQAQEFRTWTSKGGSYKIEAKLIKESNGTLFLEKRNGEKLEVPLASLSDLDNEFVKKLSSSGARSESVAGPARVDDAETKTRPQHKSAKDLPLEPLDDWNLTPDPFKSTLTSKTNSIDLDMEHVFGTMAVSPDRSTMYACYKHKALNQYVQKVDLLTGNLVGDAQMIATTAQGISWDLLDASPDKEVFMAYNDRGRTANTLSIVHYDTLHPIATFQPYGARTSLAYAQFVDDHHFLTVSEAGLMGLWNIKTLKLLWRTNITSRPVLSPNRKLLFVHLNSTHLAALDPLTGQVKGMRPANVKGVSELAVNDSFTKLVGVGMGCCRVWDLKTGKLTADFSISASLRNCDVQFVNEDQILVGHVQQSSNYKSSGLFDLVDLNLQCSMWAYGFYPAPVVGLNGQVWMAPQKALDDPFPELSSLAIPHPEAKEAIDSTSFDDVTVIDVGQALPMNLTFNSDAWNQAKVEENAKKFLGSLGFELDLDESETGFDIKFAMPSSVRDRTGNHFVQDMGLISFLFKWNGQTMWRADHTRDFQNTDPQNRESLFDNPWVGWVMPKTFRFYKPVLDGSRPEASANGTPTFAPLTFYRDYEGGFSWGIGSKSKRSGPANRGPVGGRGGPPRSGR